MDKNIFIICKPNSMEGSSTFEAFLEEDGIFSIEESPWHNKIALLQEEMLQQLEDSIQYAVKKNWYEGQEKNFVHLIKETIASKHTGDLYFSSSYNFFFIELWRYVSRQLNLKVKFIVDYSPIFSKGIVSEPSELYLMYLALLQNHGDDIHIYHSDDFNESDELFEYTLSKILGKNDFIAMNPTEFLLKNLQTFSKEKDDCNQPFELELIDSIFRKKRFGSPLVFSDEVAITLKIVDSMHAGSAVFFWLNSFSDNPESKNFNFGVKSRLSLNNNFQDSLSEMATGFKEKLRRLKVENIALKSKLEEAEAEINQMKKRLKNVRLQNKNVITSATDINDRKKAKFKRDPYAYFNDSKKNWVRLLRFLYLHKRK